MVFIVTTFKYTTFKIAVGSFPSVSISVGKQCIKPETDY